MKNVLTLLVFITTTFCALAQGPLITEIHYNNSFQPEDPFGRDSTEYVEVYLPDPQPTDLTDWVVASYEENTTDNSIADFYRSKDLTDTIRTEKTPNGKYYVIEFEDSILTLPPFGDFNLGGLPTGDDAVALIEKGSPNVVHQFWRYASCASFTATGGPADGATPNPITEDFSRTCGTAGVSLVQQSNGIPTMFSLQQNGFGDWGLAPMSADAAPLENPPYSDISFPGNVPVELTYFKGKETQDGIELLWETATELDNDYFKIEHSIDGISFRPLTQILGAGESIVSSKYTKL